ncbi:MFS transporter [Francisella hispaniensis]|uniref:MFS transporter n=1 Tax=Francisella hispaniensis FSC454 TaxID=1088883 RepID=A0AAC9NQ08_9GAMM|nr:MFS transporter [Francisella hispaniensis]APD50622.1 MFS transporter [Francisella hispaniensis FSC454]KYW82520.1 MFS transporter [Francisella hispaniensis FSC454]
MLNYQTNKISSDKTIIFLLCFFGLMSQLAIDSFTPSLPYITKYFNTVESVTKLTVGLYFFGMACSMLIFGHLSDRYGRKRSLIIGYIIFFVASIFCSISQSPIQLLFFRFLQGIGMSCSFVSYRAIMKDAFDNDSQSLANANLIVSSIVLFVPPLSPLIGGLVQQFVGWRSNFTLHAVLAIVTIYLIFQYLHLKPLVNTKSRWLESYKKVLSNKSFILNSVCSGLASSLMFSFVEVSPYFFQVKMGFSTIGYSLTSATMIVVPVIFILLLKNRVSKMDMDKVMLYCASISVFFSMLLILSYFIVGISPFIIILLCTIIITGNAFQYTATYVAAYRGVDDQVGASSALFCFIKILMAAAFSLVVSYVYVKNQASLGLIIGLPPLAIIILKIIDVRN